MTLVKSDGSLSISRDSAIDWSSAKGGESVVDKSGEALNKLVSYNTTTHVLNIRNTYTVHAQSYFMFLS